MKKLILGLGAGRCGTHSLARLISMQQEIPSRHEAHPIPWEKDLGEYKKYSQELMAIGRDTICEVAFYLLPYYEWLCRDFEVKVACLCRGKEESIRSFMKKTEGRNHWTLQDHPSWELGSWERDEYWDTFFPKYPLPKEQAIERYWTEYYELAFEYQNSNPEGFRVFDMDTVLNTEPGQLSMLSFLGVENPVVLTNIKLDASN